MSNWICKECGANYIDVSHQEPSVLKQELEIRELKELLKECREWIYEDMSEDVEVGRMEFLTKIDNAIGGEKK